ncbi:MAG: ATP-binding cassette domain-containing protein [Patulibacter sp.]|nr:ATP-binding cassette domain-containing protein [Patulibacter sp.]
MTTTHSSEPAVAARGLTKRFGDTQALAGIDLEVPAGSILGVLGPNGAGKTTAVRILATLLRPDAGEARIGGLDIVRDAGRVRQLIGLTGQYASVDETLSGMQNLVMIGRLLDLSGKQAKLRAKELLEWFDLTEAASRPARTYSGGMRRRLDLAASLVGRPSVVFLDEPTTGLDPTKRDDMWNVVRTIVDEGASVLLTTQYLEEADALADRITVIDRGRVIADDTPNALKTVVGGQTLVVRPADQARLMDTRRILHDLGGMPVESPGNGVLSVAVDGDDDLAAAVARLGAAGIRVTELSLRLPSLDEVFFSLTQGPGSARAREAATELEVAA